MLIRSRVMLVLVAGSMTLAACASEEPSGDASDAPPKKISMILGFLPSGAESPFYVAAAKGFFEERGLEVEIRPGESSSLSVSTVASGEVEFGVADLASVALAKSEDPATPVTAVAALQVRSPYMIASLRSGADISEPEDMEGAEVYLSATSTLDEIIKGWAARESIDGIRFKNVDPSTQYQLLLTGRIPSTVIFATTVPSITMEAAEEGEELVTLNLAEHGLDDFYGNTLVMNDEFAQEEPELAQGFVDAMLEAYEYSFEHPEEAGEILAEAVPTVTVESTVARLEVQEDLMLDGGRVVNIGAFDADKVDAMLEFLKENLGVAEDLDVEQIVSFDFITP